MDGELGMVVSHLLANARSCRRASSLDASGGSTGSRMLITQSKFHALISKSRIGSEGGGWLT